jgi:SET domain-containing protein
MANIKSRILASLKKTCCRLRVSKIEGIGVVAIRNIKKGENIFFGVRPQAWRRFSPAELKDLDPEVKKMIGDFFGADEKGEFLIPGCALNGMDISFFLNTADRPNVITRDGGLTFYAAKNIKKGGELMVSYRSYDARY